MASSAYWGISSQKCGQDCREAGGCCWAQEIRKSAAQKAETGCPVEAQVGTRLEAQKGDKVLRPCELEA